MRHVSTYDRPTSETEGIGKAKGKSKGKGKALTTVYSD
jgi:hypothetical protein